jgi:hypothetical protein
MSPDGLLKSLLVKTSDMSPKIFFARNLVRTSDMSPKRFFARNYDMMLVSTVGLYKASMFVPLNKQGMVVEGEGI